MIRPDASIETNASWAVSRIRRANVAPEASLPLSSAPGDPAPGSRSVTLGNDIGGPGVRTSGRVLAEAYGDPTFVFEGTPILGAHPETSKESDMVLVLIANIVLCALVIVAVVTPLARAIGAPRSAAAATLRRRHTMWTSTPAASGMRTPAPL